MVVVNPERLKVYLVIGVCSLIMIAGLFVSIISAIRKLAGWPATPDKIEKGIPYLLFPERDFTLYTFNVYRFTFIIEKRTHSQLFSTKLYLGGIRHEARDRETEFIANVSRGS